MSEPSHPESSSAPHSGPEDREERSARLDADTPVDQHGLGRSGELPTLVDPSSFGSGARPQGDENRLARGTTLGRYVVLERIGSGGMGVVYAAYDPQLDRKVALKLLHGREERNGDTGGRSRVLREAQAMARLSHPNVVAVHDVGVVDETLFVAMEFVEGITLGSFIAEGPRRWSEVLAVFEPAGRGLAAAHAAGLVHRDFKPDNVMIGSDGRVRVMDFGLARAAAEISTDTSERNAGAIVELSGMDRLTRTGALVGTPAYMAPELLGGGNADARSDQFAFCVALHRALYGTPPYSGDTLVALFAEVSSGRIATTPPRIRVPHWLASAVRRGLHPEPSRRFASMHDLLFALERGRRRRGQWVVAAVGLGVVGALGIGSLAAAGSGCTEGRDKLDVAWSSDRRDEVRRVFMGSGAADAEGAADRSIAAIDDWTERWADAHLQACEANRGGEQSDALLDLRMACLDRRATELDAVAAVLGEADRDVVLRAADVVAALPDLQECSDAERLLAMSSGAPDAATAAAVEALRPTLARARALLDARRDAEGIAVARPLVSDAEALGYRPLLAEALYVLGLLVFDSGEVAESVEILKRACFEAEAGKHDEIAVRAWSMLVHVQGFTLSDREAGDDAETRAEAAMLRAGSPPDLVADVLHNRAAMYLHRGEHERALADFEESLRLRIEVHGELHLDVGEGYTSVGNALYHLGRPADALVQYEKGRAVLEQVVGPRHPSVANAVENIGSMLMVTGHPEQGREKMQEALGMLEESLGPEHPSVGQVLFNLGWICDALGDYEAALAYFERGRKLELPRLGPEHPLVGEYEASIGTMAHKLEREDVAREHLERALPIFAKALGPDHNNLARVHNDLGNVARAQGRLQDAVREHRAALRIRRKALPGDHPELAMTLENLALVLVATRDYAEAAVIGEELVRIREGRADDADQLVDALLVLAAARKGLGQREKARPLVERAQTVAAPLDDDARESVAEALRELDDDR